MFNLTIVTPEKIFYEGEATSLIVPGMEGYLGVLKDHAPLITAIVPGKVTLKESDGKELELSISYGFFEVSSNHATLLADSIEYVGEIDLERAKAGLDRSRARLREAAGEIDTPRAKKAYERAKSRVLIARGDKSE